VVLNISISNFFRYIFIIMEYCEHGDLSCFIRKRRKLPETICKKFLQQLALALKFLRSHNVCHMDLKPQNLLLTCKPNLTLKLAGKYVVILVRVMFVWWQ
jgi:serine/threonine-protein kinase ULK/ATG1